MNRVTISRIVTSLLLLIVIISNVCAQEGPTYVISNSPVTIPCDAWVVDPDSLRGNYPVGNTTMVITSSGGSKMGIQVDSSYLREDQDFINVYDGPTTSSPLLTTITRSNWTDAGFSSSGSVITILFHAHGTGAFTSTWGWRLRIRCIQDVTQVADFLPIYQDPTVTRGNIQLNDYDKDGDKDLLVGGVVYRNDSHDDSLYVFDRVLKPLGNWKNTNMVAADFDNDGSKDVFITGDNEVSGITTRRAMIFKNTNGVFSAVNGTPFVPAILGAVSVVDFNKDGKPDIAYSGHTGAGYIFQLYLNNGNFSFTEKTISGLPGLTDASMSWHDYDNDGDLDLLYNGSQGNIQPETGLFNNNANNSFTHVDLVMFHTNSGDIKWVDVNMDGKYDIVNTGFNYPQGGIVPEILFNNGNNTFTRVITNLPSGFSTHFDWADYDRDGDMDIVLTGTTSTSPGVGINQDAAYYKNNGNGSFTKKELGGIESLATPRWVDFNNDSKWDIFIPARGFHPSLLYKNMGNDSFQVSSYPFTAYELTGTALAEDFTNDGFIDILFAGELNDQDCNEGNSSVLIKSLGWRVYPTVVLTPVINLGATFSPLTSFDFRYWRWGDVDSDGKADILVTNDTYNPSNDSLRIYKNNGNDNFTLLYKGFPMPNHYNNQVGVVDVNNDGINELFLAPNKLCRWNGSGFTSVSDELNYCGPGGCDNFYYDFADFNKDGLMDVAYSAAGMVHILKNTGNSRFESITGGWYVGLNDKYLEWADFDHDGDPDLLTDRGIFENTSWGGFRYRDVDIPAHGHTGVADINNDGWIDIFTLQSRSTIGPSKLYYNQQGKLFFQDKTPEGFIQINNGVLHEGAEAFDIDSDGDIDLVYAVGSFCSNSGIFLNTNNLKTSNVILRAPNGNENYTIGSTQTIKWIGNNLSSTVKIELSLDSGLTWNMIAANAPSGKYSGQFQWQVNGVAASTKCLVRITDNSNNALLDKSNQTFTLSISIPTPVTGIQAIKHTRIYPNPVQQGRVYLEIQPSLSGKKVSLDIFNTDGKLVGTRKFTAQNGIREINLQHLTTGVYFIRILVGNKPEIHKIIKL